MRKVFKGLSILVAATAMCGGIAMATACDSGYNGTYTGSYSYTNGYGATYGMMVEVTVKNNVITDIKDITNTDLDKQAGYVQKDNKEYEYKTSGVEWHEVSDGWTNYFNNSGLAYWALFTLNDKDGKLIPGMDEAIAVDAKGTELGGLDAKKSYIKYKNADGKIEPNKYVEYVYGTVPTEDVTNTSYGWTDTNEKTWTNHVSYLLQKYVGMSVADVLDITVYTNYGYSPMKDDKTKLVPDNSVSGEPYGTDFNDELAASGLLVTGSTQGSGRLLLAVQDALKNK